VTCHNRKNRTESLTVFENMLLNIPFWVNSRSITNKRHCGPSTTILIQKMRL